MKNLLIFVLLSGLVCANMPLLGISRIEYDLSHNSVPKGGYQGLDDATNNIILAKMTPQVKPILVLAPIIQTPTKDCTIARGKDWLYYVAMMWGEGIFISPDANQKSKDLILNNLMWSRGSNQYVCQHT